MSLIPWGRQKGTIKEDYKPSGWSYIVSRAPSVLALLYQRSGHDWKRLGENYCLELFQSAAKRIPAYKDYLKKAKINPSKIRSFKDWQAVPRMEKQEYLRSYPLEKLCWDGSLSRSMVFAVTSGSTGKPFYFPREDHLNWQSSILHEMFLKNSGLDPSKSTLVIVGFGMGAWIGGLITYRAFNLLSYREYPVSILTPGTNKKEIFEALKTLAPKYSQVVLCGYPPFVKDIIDEGATLGVHWRKINLRIIFAAEPFSEKFRDYILRKTGMKNPYTSTMNIYGSADLGTMAVETPLTILIRRLATKNKKLQEILFAGVDRLPTLAQFDPIFTHFEEVGGQILVTGYNSLPLIRYPIGDHGVVIQFNEMAEKLKSADIDIHAEMQKAGIERMATQLPFVAVYERADFSTKLYGAIIYPEPIREALQNRSLERFVTGKFAMITKHNRHEDEYLEVNIELKQNVKNSKLLESTIGKAIAKSLTKHSTEYSYLIGLMPKRVYPKVVLWPYEDPTHFRSGIKQKWVKK